MRMKIAPCLNNLGKLAGCSTNLKPRQLTQQKTKNFSMKAFCAGLTSFLMIPVISFYIKYIHQPKIAQTTKLS